MRQKVVDGVANSVDPDHAAPEIQSELDLHCLHRPACLNAIRIR